MYIQHCYLSISLEFVYEIIFFWKNNHKRYSSNFSLVIVSTAKMVKTAKKSPEEKKLEELLEEQRKLDLALKIKQAQAEIHAKQQTLETHPKTPSDIEETDDLEEVDDKDKAKNNEGELLFCLVLFIKFVF